MKRFKILILVWAAALAGLPVLCADPLPTNVRVQNVLKQFVVQNNAEVVGLGSWISGKKYADPLAGGKSDHDMRLLLPQGTSEEEALRQWQSTREQLVGMFRGEFGEEADKILKTVNLYPPTQLMQGVEDGTDAAERFIGMRTVPNLGYSGPVDANMEEGMVHQLTEGLYGPGAAAFTQKYEESAGKLFYAYDGKAMTGMTDLVHETEGVATYSASGLGNTSLQWIEHGEEALHDGNAKSLAKYLERLERDLVKGRDLARCPIDEAYLKELMGAASALRANPEEAAQYSQRIGELLRRAQLDAVLLDRFDEASEAEQALIKAALESEGQKGGLGALLLQKADELHLQELVEHLMNAWTVLQASDALGEGDTAGAATMIAGMFVDFTPAQLMDLTNRIIEATKDAGFSLMANTQDAADLLAGIFTAGGRADAEAKAFTLDQLVANFSSEDKVWAFVEQRCIDAADRGWGGSATRAADRGVADAIFKRCYPKIIAAWRARRDVLSTEFRRLESQLARDGMVLGYSPAPATLTPAQAQIRVTVTARTSDRDQAKKLERMKTIAQLLLGPRSKGFWASVDYYWHVPGDTQETLGSSRQFNVSRGGTYKVAVRCVISSDGIGVPGGSSLHSRVERKASVDVVVTSTIPPPKKPTTQTKSSAAPAAAVPKGPTAAKASTGSGHWERTAVSIQWASSQPVDHTGGKERQLGPIPHSGDHWHGTDTWWTTLVSVSSTHVAMDAHDERAAPTDIMHSDTSWSEPPAVLSPGQSVNLTTTGNGFFSSGSIYAYEGSQNHNERLAGTDGFKKTYTVPGLGDVSADPSTATMGFFVGTGEGIKVVYSYKWVGTSGK